MQTTILAKVRTLGGIAVCGALLAAATAQVADAAWCGVTVTADGATINLTANEDLQRKRPDHRGRQRHGQRQRPHDHGQR